MKRPRRGSAAAPQTVCRRQSAKRRSYGRAAWLLAAILLLSGAAVGGYFGGAAGLPWLTEQVRAAPVFRLEGVAVRGNRNLDETEIMEAAGLDFGESLLLLDLNEIRGRLLGHSLVRNATVRRRLPSELVVEIEERIPAALLRGSPRYIVDTEGYVMAVAGTDERYPLPCISGVDLKDGEVTAEGLAEIQAGIEIFKAMRDEGFPSMEEVDCVDFSHAADAVITSVGSFPPVHIGRSDIRDRLRRWRLVADDIESRLGTVEYIDLRAAGMVVTRPLPSEEGSGAEEDRG